MKKIILCCAAILLLLFVVLGGVYASYKEAAHYLYEEIIRKGKSLLLVPSQSSEVTFTSGDLTLRGSLFLPQGTPPFPGIVLTHGGTSLGSKLPLYRVLSDKLVRQGYGVLSFDFRGYGESEDPQEIDSPEDLNFVEDVTQAVSFLSSIKEIDRSQIFLVGHSFGAGVVIPAGIEDPRVKGIVAIAPGRRGKELFWSEDAPIKHYPRERLSQDMEIPHIHDLSIEFVNPILEYVTIDTALTYPEHPPILLIDGEQEDARDQAFLQQIYQEMTPPKTYITIQDAGHYFGVKTEPEYQEEPFITYWGQIVDDLIRTIDQWIRSLE